MLRENSGEEAEDLCPDSDAHPSQVLVKTPFNRVVLHPETVSWQRCGCESAPVRIEYGSSVADLLPNQWSACWAWQSKVSGDDLRELEVGHAAVG
jgi:hypothetical protein